MLPAEPAPVDDERPEEVREGMRRFLLDIVEGRPVPVVRASSGVGYCAFVIADDKPRPVHAPIRSVLPRSHHHRVTCPRCRAWATAELTRV